MRSKDVVIGMRVQIFQKTARPFTDLEDWKKFIEENYRVLVPDIAILKVDSWYKRYRSWLLVYESPGMRLCGTFNAKDFELYKENENEV